MMKKLILILASAAALLTMTSCGEEIVPQLILKFDQDEYVLDVDQELDLYFSLGMNTHDAVFSSSDENVATVTAGGLVKAVAPGTVTITAELNGKSASCQVTVSPYKAKSITLTYPRTGLTAKCWGEISVEVSPEKYNMEDLVWEFGKVDYEYESEKVSASSYKVRFLEYVEGRTLTFTVKDRNSDAFATGSLSVLKGQTIGVVGISLCPEELSLPLGSEPFALDLATAPADYDRNVLVWESSDETVLTVKAGVLTFVKEGTAEITVTDPVSERSAKAKITVTDGKVNNDVELSQILLDKVHVEKREGDGPFQLIATCYTGSEMTEVPNYTDLEWSSDTPGVATVSQQGVVSIKAAGVAGITVRDKAKPLQVMASCRVSVSNEEVKVTDLYVTTSMTLKEGESFYLEPSVGPVDAVNKNLVFKSDNPQVADVDNQGNVTAISEGIAEIAVMAMSGVSARCVVTVISSKVNVTGVLLNVSDLKMAAGQEYTVIATVLPDNATEKTVSWSSSDESVATVSGGKVRTLKEGTAVITAVADGVSAECRLEVTKDVVSIDGITQIELVRKQTRLLSYTASGQVTWKVTEGAEYISVDGNTGLLVAKAVGNAKVAALVNGQVARECAVVVTPVMPTSISIVPSEVTVSKGSTYDLECVFEPSDCDYRDIVWSSASPTTAKVENGTVTAVEIGKVRITAKTADGKLQSSCEVKVENPKHRVVLKVLDNEVLTNGLEQDQTIKIKAYYTAGEALTDPYTPVVTEWKSEDPTLISVDQEGNVTNVAETLPAEGKKAGVTHIADGVRQTIYIQLVRATAREVVITALPENDVVYFEDEFRFEAKVLPAKADQEIRWIATGGPVDYETGMFKADAVGTVNLTAFAYEDGRLHVAKNYSFEVRYRTIESAQLSNTEQDMSVGQTMFLTVDIQPVKGTDKSLKWESSAPEVVSVKDGFVTALAEGEAEIKVTLSDERVLTCRITVSKATAQVKVGDYYYSDGSTSAELDPSKTLVGVVFSTDNATLSDGNLKADYPGCTHGLVIGTAEYSASHGYLHSQYTAEWLKSKGYDALNEGITNGYSNTIGLSEYRNEKGGNYALMFDVTTGVPATHNSVSDVSALSCSSWYVPSFKEMCLIYENRETINSALKAASGMEVGTGRYWLSSFLYTEPYGDLSYRAFEMSTGQWSGVQPLYSTSYPVRVVLAF